MRLICPNCGAQYEVPEDAVPLAGRDVQCSACQHIWFEKGRPTPPPRLLNPQPWDEVPRVEGDDEEEDDLADLRDSPPPIPVARPRVDPEVSRILREEAERESLTRTEEAARRAIPDPAGGPSSPAPDDPVERAVADIASQDEVDRAAVARDDGTSRALQAQPQGTPTPRAPEERPLRPLVEERPPEPVRPAPPRPAVRSPERGLDVAELNATLRSQADRLGAKAPRIEGTRNAGGGFGRGFWGTLLVLAVLAALYVFRPEIVEIVPSAATLLDPYAAAVDSGRIWLDRQIGSLLGAQTAAVSAP